MSPEARLFDAHGRELPRERVRRAAGFTERYVREDEPTTITGITPAGPRSIGWRDEPGRIEHPPVGEDPACAVV